MKTCGTNKNYPLENVETLEILINLGCLISTCKTWKVIQDMQKEENLST
jgi:hypothetical protein